MATLTGTSENLAVVNRFDLEIDSVNIGHVVSVSGIGDTTDVIDAPAVNAKGNPVKQKVAGNTSYNDLNFVLHLTNEKFVNDWMNEVQTGKFSKFRRNGSIVMFDTMGKEQVRANFVNAFPSQVSVSGLSAGTDEAITMSVTLVHEGLTLAFS